VYVECVHPFDCVWAIDVAAGVVIIIIIILKWHVQVLAMSLTPSIVIGIVIIIVVRVHVHVIGVPAVRIGNGSGDGSNDNPRNDIIDNNRLKQKVEKSIKERITPKCNCESKRCDGDEYDLQ